MESWVKSSGLNGCHSSSRETRLALLSLAKETGREDEIRCWSRLDFMAGTLKSTSKVGPQWNHVVGRVTVDCGTEEILSCDLIETIPRSAEHSPIRGGQRDTKTFLLFVDQRPYLRRSEAATATGNSRRTIDNLGDLFPRSEFGMSYRHSSSPEAGLRGASGSRGSARITMPI